MKVLGNIITHRRTPTCTYLLSLYKHIVFILTYTNLYAYPYAHIHPIRILTYYTQNIHTYMYTYAYIFNRHAHKGKVEMMDEFREMKISTESGFRVLGEEQEGSDFKEDDGEEREREVCQLVYMNEKGLSKGTLDMTIMFRVIWSLQ